MIYFIVLYSVIGIIVSCILLDDVDWTGMKMYKRAMIALMTMIMWPVLGVIYITLIIWVMIARFIFGKKGHEDGD